MEWCYSNIIFSALGPQTLNLPHQHRPQRLDNSQARPSRHQGIIQVWKIEVVGPQPLLKNTPCLILLLGASPVNIARLLILPRQAHRLSLPATGVCQAILLTWQLMLTTSRQISAYITHLSAPRINCFLPPVHIRHRMVNSMTALRKR